MSGMKHLFCASLALLFSATLVSSCNHAPTTADLRQQVQNPKVGDVYVVRFQPQGKPEHRYYFYRVAAVRPADIDLHPARQDAADSLADVSVPNFFAEKPLIYTRPEALELLYEQPGDVQHSRLVAVRR
ncbi:hypothetical protein GCM10027346_11040 [Hymenobacter seoulensis]